MEPASGYAFPGPTHLHADIYPAIAPALTPSLHQPAKTILITGAGRGIGRATALQYAHAHVARLILCARTAAQLDDVAACIAAINPAVRVRTYVLDVSDAAAVQRIAARVALDMQADDGPDGARLDVLVNNAGAAEPWVPLAQADAEQWWRTFEVNLKGPFLCLHAFLPLLVATAAGPARAEGVHVVNVTSIGAMVVWPGASAYQTSKLALCRLTEFVAAEYGDKGVGAVSLHPGAVPTALSEGIDAIKDYIIDTPELSGGFVVWLTAKKREWLHGRYVSATWDVDVLEGMRDEIVQGKKLKFKMIV